MQRNIISTIKFSSGKVNITVLEKLASNTVEIFNVSSEAKLVNSFLAKSLKEIEAIIGGALTEVSVVIEPTMKTDAKTIPHRQSINIAGDVVTKVDIENAMQLTKNAYESKERRVILTQPIKFDVFDVMTKSYNKAPIHKKGSKLTVTSVVTTIDGETYEFVNTTISAHGLKIAQILLAPQAITQNNLSSSALTNGAILIHIGMNQSFITINKNLSTIASMSIYDFGYKNLVNGVAKIFGCSKKEANDLLAAHGTLDNTKNNRVIFSRQEGIEEKIHYAYELQTITKSFVSKLFLVAQKFISQKNVGHLPLVISGMLNDTDDLNIVARQYLNTPHISLFTPLSFIEMNNDNIETIGTLKFIERMDELLGRQFNTIVETNPNSISTLRKPKSQKTWLAKLTDKIGGKYEWN